MSNEKKDFPCSNDRPCVCPNVKCKNHGTCCACVEAHRKAGSLPLCFTAEKKE